MKTKIKELGYGLISILLFQIALSLVSIKTCLNFIELKNFTGTVTISSPQLIFEIIASALLIVSIILLPFKPKAGIIIYIISIFITLIISIIFTTVGFKDILTSLLFPGITLFLIYIKRNIIF